MHQNIIKKMETISLALNELSNITKRMIKYGSQAALILLIFGTSIIISNHFGATYDSYYEFIAINIIKNSFIILAEVIIGGLLVEYVFKKS